MSGPRTASRRRLGAASFEDAFIFTVDGGARAPADARHALADALDEGADADALANCSLLLSEVVTNCVVHGGADDGDSIEVAGGMRGATLRVEVAAEGEPFEHEPMAVDAEAPGGRGLYLVDALAKNWGVVDRGARTEVWFEVPLRS